MEISSDGGFAKDPAEGKTVAGGAARCSLKARQEAAQSMDEHQASQQITSRVVDRISRPPNEVANAVAKASTKREDQQLTDPKGLGNLLTSNEAEFATWSLMRMAMEERKAEDLSTWSAADGETIDTSTFRSTRR